MRKNLKIISVIIVLLLVCTSAYASVSDDEIQNVLTNTKIVPDYGDTVFNRESTVTRAQMCNILSQVLNINDNMVNGRDYTYFKDVPNDYWALAEINTMYEMKIINGTSEGMFSPEESLSTVQCYKMFINILNYKLAAESWGGYPTGYIYVASKLGLSDGVETKDAVNGADVARIIYNALDINSKSASGYAEDGIYYDYGDSENNKILDSHNLIKDSGRIIKNDISALGYNVSPSKDGYVNIDGTEYKCGETDISEYLGYNVDFYYNETSNEILCFVLNEDAKSVVIKSDDIVDSDSYYITYTDDNSKDKKINLSKSANVIYNGKAILPNDSVFDIDNGIITVMDSGSNEGYDTVFINKYEYYVAYGATERDTIYLSSGTYDGKPYINLANEEFVIKKDGAEISSTDIEQDSVIALRVSADKKLFLVDVLESLAVSGTIESIAHDEEITIDGNTYKLSSMLKVRNNSALEIGKSGVFYLDLNGNVFYVDFESNMLGTYAYVEKKKFDAFKDEYSLLLYTENEKEEELDFASNVKVYDDFGDGIYTYKSMKAEKAYDYVSPKVDAGHLLIKYSSNKDGMLNAIYLPSDGRADGYTDGRHSLDLVIDDSTYYAYGRFVNKAHIGSKTKIFVISNDQNGNCDAKYSYVSNGGYFDSGTNYGSSTDPIYFYNVSETGISGAVLVIEKLTSEYGSLGSGESFSTFVVTATGEATDSDGDEKKTVTVSFGGSESTVNFADNARPLEASLVQKIDDLKFGDVLIYLTNNLGEISDWEVIMRADSFKEGLLDSRGGGYYNAYATAFTVMGGRACAIDSNAVKIKANGNSYTFTNSGIKFTKVNLKRKTISDASMSDCICVNSDDTSVNSMVIIVANRNAANYCIIFE